MNLRRRSMYDTPTPPPKHVEAEDKLNRVLSILDPENETSLINLIDSKETSLRNNLRKLPTHFLEMDETDLKKIVNPTPMDNRIRMAFWYEIDLAIRDRTKLKTDRIYAGLLARESFQKRYLLSSRLLAWVVRPLPAYESVLKEAVFAGLAQCRKILDAPLYDEKGKFLNGNAKTVMQAARLFQDRLQGSIVQRTAHASAPTGAADVLPTPSTKDLAMLDSKIAQLENDIETTTAQVLPQGESDE